MSYPAQPPVQAVASVKLEKKSKAELAGYMTLGVVAGGAFISLYGIVLTYLVQTIPPTDTPTAGSPEADELGRQRKLKQTMVGLTATIGAVGIIFGITAGVKTKGPLQAVIFLLLFGAVSVFFLISTAITFTQDSRITGQYVTGTAGAGQVVKSTKTGVAVGIGVSAVSTVGFGAGVAYLFIKNLPAIKATIGKVSVFGAKAARSQQVQKYVKVGGGPAGSKAAQHVAKKAAQQAKKAGEHAAKKAAHQAAKHAKQVQAAAGGGGAAVPSPPQPTPA
jgi:uncharacterized membrane protein YgaE (UPF0421/DUF939 family)